MSSELETSRERTVRFATGFLDFARNDIVKISDRFWMRCIRVN
jgi:hypothetical protein